MKVMIAPDADRAFFRASRPDMQASAGQANAGGGSGS